MNVWTYLKCAMKKHSSAIAFDQDNITYQELINIIEERACKIPYINRAVIVSDLNKKEQALSILTAIASNNIPVPVDIKYEKNHLDEIKELLYKNKSLDPNVAIILFTSGTTGRSKGVMLSHQNILENIKGIEQYFNVNKGEKLLISRSLIHVSAIVGELLFGLYKGLTINFYEEEFQPIRLSKYIYANKVNIVCCTPTLFYYLSRFLKDHFIKSIVLSGEIINSEHIRIAKEKFPEVNFYNVYGLTENSPRVSALIPDDFFKKAGSVGKPLINTKVRVVNGELVVNSKSIMIGYLGDKTETDKKIKNGELFTGDNAKIDSDGYLYILGRKDDMINRSGMNIYPSEIENVALMLDCIEKCRVYGVNDIYYGQKICMDVVAKITVDEIRLELSKKLPQYLIPDVIFKVDSIKVNRNGKIERKNS